MATNEVQPLRDSEHHITVHRSQCNIICCVWWNLQNFSDLKPNVIYSCPLDSTKNLCCPDWMLGLKIFESNVFISLKVNIVDRDVTFSLITDGSQTPFIITSGKENTPGIYCSLVPRSVLENHSKAVSNSNLVIMCRVALNDKDLVETNFSNPACSCGNLTRDLETIFVSQLFSDIKLIKGQTEFPAHKCFLNARSSFLRHALDTDPRANNNRLVLQYDEAISDAAVVEVLRYIYSGSTATLNPDLTVSIHHIAGDLDLAKLQERCLSFLMSNISVEAFLRIYSFALATKSKPLRDKAEIFFTRNKKEILKECFPDIGGAMIRPYWIKPQEYLILETEMKRLTKTNMTTLFFDSD